MLEFLRKVAMAYWASLSLGMQGLRHCPGKGSDVRALCAPRVVTGALSAADMDSLLEAMEVAADASGAYGAGPRARRGRPSGVALPLSVLYKKGGASGKAALEAAMRAVNATVAALKDGCDAVDPVLYESVVARYDAEAPSSRSTGPLAPRAAPQVADGSRYSASVNLTPPRRAGVSVPAYARLEPQQCARRSGGDARETCVDPKLYPERRFAREAFSADHPLLDYDAALCPRTCGGESCDVLLETEELASLHRRGCDCALCDTVAGLSPERRHVSAFPDAEDDDGEDAYFDGGGERFASLRDATFFHDAGDAVVHGGRLKHGPEPVSAGDRYVLNFLFDEKLCRDAEKNFDAFLTKLVISIALPICVYFIASADVVEEVAANKKFA